MKKIEKSVLGKLEIDARMPLSKVGKAIKKSQQQVFYTVNALEKKEIIKQYYTLIDYSKLGLVSFRVYFKVHYINQKKFDELVQYLVDEPHTSWIATCGGRYDLVCTFLTANPSQFNKVLRGIMAAFPERLQNYEVLTTIVMRYFGRKYLLQDYTKLNELFCGGDREPERLDLVDLKILYELSTNARKSAVDIANRIGCSSKTIIHRIRALKKKEVILGFKPVLDMRSVHYTNTVFHIRYHNVSIEVEEGLIVYLKAHPAVKSIVKTLGEWDIEIYIETKDAKELREFEMELRQQFAAIIQQTESIPIYQSFKKNYFPEFLL